MYNTQVVTTWDPYSKW